MAVHQAQITLYKVVNVEQTTRYYLLQNSTSTTPSKPTTNPPGGNWVTTEPTYTSGSTNTLYFVDLTVYSNKLPDTNVNFSYSAVSKSSSYEAAKEAYNEAEAAAKKLASWCAANNQTLIDGSKIYTGSVGAKQINVTDLFAQDVTASGTITGSTLKGSSAELTSGKIGPFNLDPGGLSSTLNTSIEYSKKDIRWASYELNQFEENDSIVVFAKSLSMGYIDSCSFTANVSSLTSGLPDYRALDVDGNIVSNITALQLIPVFLAGGNIYYASSFSNLDINNAKTSAKSSGAKTFNLGLQVRVAGTTSGGAVVNPIIKIKWAAQNQQVYWNRAFTDNLLDTFKPKATITVSSVDIAMTVDEFRYGALEVGKYYTYVRNILDVTNEINTRTVRLGNSDMEYLDSSAKGIFAYKYVNSSSGFSCPALYIYPAYTRSDNVNRICSYNWLDDPTDYDDPYTECSYTKLPLDIEASELRLNGKGIIDLIYPVGAIFMSTVNKNPETYLGGTWVAWGSGKVPVGVDTNDSNFNTVEKTGGSANAVAVSHTHTQASHDHSPSGGSNYGFAIYKAGSGVGRVKVNTSNGTRYTFVGKSGSADADSSGLLWYKKTSDETPAINSSGEDGAGKNLQPYITCYMWKRTA